jgi:hypothetical protein
MRFGIFDHRERAVDRPATQTYEERIRLVQAAEDAGFMPIILRSITARRHRSCRRRIYFWPRLLSERRGSA